ncbi:MAG: DUF418 domain-containing protein [Balneolaceae bacterium]|nr:DUF418 domain-containing protein [Balneolaceae bacterium]
MESLVQPVQQKSRIQSLDILRGIAILGILILNIQSFAMPGAAYLNPTAFGDFDGLNFWVWLFSHAFADQKFITIFSILFGAGIVLVTQKAEAKSGKSAGLHYKRNFWLLIIGLIHAHLIWYGDILVAYALGGFIVYFFRKMQPRTLLILGTLVFSVHSVLYIMTGTSIPYWPQEALQDTMLMWHPPTSEIQQEINALTGSLSEQINYNSAGALVMETMVYAILFFWKTTGLMLIGMALYKMGILSAERSSTFYKRGLLVGFIIGFPIVIYGMIQNLAVNFSFEYSMFLGSQYNYWGSLFVSFGYICAVMLLAKSGKFEALKSKLAAVGQMALTNYIAQSVIGVLLFFGIGFGLFGEVDRIMQLTIVFAIWALQLWWSKPWLDRYKFGPLEWVWRSLSYWKKQPMKRS